MNLVERFHEGGFFMYFILAFGICTAYIIADRVWALYFRVKPVSNSFKQQLRDYLKRGDLTGAQEFARNHKNVVAAPIVELACKLKAEASGEEELQSRIDEALSEEIARLDKRTGFLAVFGNVATLLGLLGTISGMITSFAAVAGVSSMERATMLSKGISEAMNCTAFGLLVAIPALVAYAFFQSKTESLTASLTDSVSKVYHDLLFLYERKTN